MKAAALLALSLASCGGQAIEYLGGTTPGEDAAVLRLTCRQAGLAALAEAERVIRETPRVNPQAALDRAQKACS